MTSQMSRIPGDGKIGVIGAGTMGSGIAQVAAAAGHPVVLYDAFEGAAEKGRKRIAEGLDKLEKRGRMTPEAVRGLLERIELAASLDDLAGSVLVIEAIVEDLSVKQDLFAALEKIVGAQAILATNTSSISITAIARALTHPERLVGMHFFNPAPVMKLVEVISGVATGRDAAQTVFATAESWGKVAVHAKSTPGFIVNRVARPFYGEALRLLEEGVADPATIDAVLTEAAGFRMGPFALMDLIGNDVNYAVSLSVYNAYYQEPRFRPSNIQLELVNAGRLGRKTGVGFYDYGPEAETPSASETAPGAGAAVFEDFLPGADIETEGIAIVLTDGRTARELEIERGKPVIVYDFTGTPGTAARMAFAASPEVSDAVIGRFAASLAVHGLKATRLPDWPGLIVLRTISMLANEGYEAVLQGVTDAQSVDAAMRFGVNYPKGPMQWAAEIGLSRVLGALGHLHAQTGDPRYRASLGLRQAASALPAT